jgi:hypothetical protein
MPQAVKIWEVSQGEKLLSGDDRRWAPDAHVEAVSTGRRDATWLGAGVLLSESVVASCGRSM